MSITSTLRTMRRTFERDAESPACRLPASTTRREPPHAHAIDARFRVVADRPGIARHRQLPRWAWDAEQDW